MGTINVSLPSDGETADVADYNTPITTIVNEINGNLDNANIKSNAAIAGSKIADNSIDIGSKASVFDGWIDISDSWVYASSTTITVPTDATTKYSVGDYIQINQSGVKYFAIVGVASTTLTVRGLNGVTVANAAISDIKYSKSASPLGVGYPPGSIAFSAYRNSSQNTGTSPSFAIINFDTEVFDTCSNFDVATNVGRFTAHVSGFYRFSARARITAADTGWLVIALYKNGSAEKIGDRVMASSSNQIAASITSGPIELAANDYVEVYSMSNSGQALATGATECWFTGEIVRR